MAGRKFRLAGAFQAYFHPGGAGPFPVSPSYRNAIEAAGWEARGGLGVGLEQEASMTLYQIDEMDGEARLQPRIRQALRPLLRRYKRLPERPFRRAHSRGTGTGWSMKTREVFSKSV
ncbi:hypothetical protein MESS4_780025 [Mesorhizobium sp. STM 4661]|nr:hypothetical protein MESS4_780025 [Mesorhizobium sp. STM 4661]